MIDLTGKTIPMDYSSLDREAQDKLFGCMGQAAIELRDIANALESQNVDWFRGCQSLALYYRTLSQNLIATQQVLFERNVTGNDNAPFAE